MKRIAIVGTGMAGLACADRFQSRGAADVVRIEMFEKSRGIGGRMATRRAGAFAFDHGAQYVTARGPLFRKLIDDAVIAGNAASWGSPAQFVGTPCMTALPRHLAMALERAGVTFHFEKTVIRVDRIDGHWQFLMADGSVVGGFDAVIFAIPSPQMAQIMRRSGLERSGLPLAAIEQALYEPCWALLLGFAENEGPDYSDWQSFNDGPIRWIARNNHKPGRISDEAVIVHGSQQWSTLHLDLPADRVDEPLLQAYRSVTGHLARPHYFAAHRWRYAQVIEAAGHPCFYAPTEGLGACGDWCLGARVEAAFDSGVAMADTFLAHAMA
jgi:renalase